MEKRLVDLHVHTTYSDGIFTPERVVKEALDRGLKAISITDHDCVDGIQPGMDAARGTDLEIVPGVELSAARNEAEIHILGYFIDWKEPVLARALKEIRESRVRRMKEMIRLINTYGANLNEDKVLRSIPTGTIGRLHLARIMTDEKITKNVREAFDRYIGNGKPCYVNHKRLDYREAIEMIKKTGGVPVLAHPGIKGRDEYIHDYVQAGLRGLEVFYIKHGLLKQGKYLALAKKYNLLVSGGSDCHGANGREESLIGRIKLDYKAVEQLKKEAEAIRAATKKKAGV